jgi:hypothetical protein
MRKAFAERSVSKIFVGDEHPLRITPNISAVEFIQISRAVAIGFAVMGFLGYFVKLIHIPMYALPCLS